MTYSIESLLFKAAVGVVNTAARAANGLLEVMYPPRYDAAHIWDDDDVPAVSSAGGPAPTGSTPGGVADPARGTPPPLAGSLTSPAADGEGDDPFPEVDDALAGNRDTKATAAGGLTWQGWAEPAVLEVLAEHRHRYASHDSIGHQGHCSCGERPISLYDWHEHIAPLIVERIACNPSRAIAALQNLQTQE